MSPFIYSLLVAANPIWTGGGWEEELFQTFYITVFDTKTENLQKFGKSLETETETKTFIYEGVSSSHPFHPTCSGAPQPIQIAL